MLALRSLSSAERPFTNTSLPLTTLGKESAVYGGEDGPWVAKKASPPLTTELSMRKLTRILRCERGANAIEYALVASLIAIAALAAFQNLGTRTDMMYNNVSNYLG